jgi:hypothetical protein
LRWPAAALESFLLHARALDDFLGCSDPRKGDVVARGYVDTWQPIHPLTAELRRNVSKRVAHLTEDRINRESIQALAILAAVAAGFERFLGTLSREQQSGFAEAATLLAALPPFVIAKATTDVDDFRAFGFAD